MYFIFSSFLHDAENYKQQIHNLHKSFICRNHLNTEINSLVIENANLTSLNLTTSLFSRIGLNNSRHISRLKKLQIVNTTLEHINICSPTKGGEDGENTNGGHHDLIDCQFLSGLNSLDLRDNNLTRLEEFKLPKLVELYLSGMYVIVTDFGYPKPGFWVLEVPWRN